MTRKIRALFVVFFAVLSCLFGGLAAEAADTFSVTIPPATEVVMKDANAVIPITVTNSATSIASIQEIDITINIAMYSISSGSFPANWCISRIRPTTGNIRFSVINPANGRCQAAPAPGVQIAPGASLTFNIIAMPLSAVSDLVPPTGDTLTTITVRRPAGFTQTGVMPSPAWTRRSLDAVMTAAPSSVNAGGEITLNMQVSNKSIASQTLIATTPAPPAAAPAIASLSAGPFYASTALSTAITATSATITVGSTTGFATAPSSIQMDSEKIWYTGMTPTSFTGLTRGYGGTTAVAHSAGAQIYRLTPFNLTASGTAGDTGTITWKYTANSAGTVSFSARANDSTLTAKSLNKASNSVIIGDFTSVIGIYPDSAGNNQNVTVSMTVKNNGSTALINAAPSVLSAGAGCLATHTLVSGPTPASISSIAPGSSGVFAWTYKIAGTAGQSYCLSGNATANGPLSTTVTTSNTGTLTNFPTTVTPATVASGTLNQTLTWTITNNGTCPVDRIEITVPTQSTCPTTGWCMPATGFATVTSPVGWTGQKRTGPPDSVRFSGASNLLAGASATLSITFSSTQTVTADTFVNFPISLREARTVAPCTSRKTNYISGTEVTVTANSMTIAATPLGPILADGSATYTINATLKNGATVQPGKTVTFTTTNGTLSSTTAITNASGIATVSLIAPYSTVNTTATVTATYMSAQATTPVLNFNGYALANLAYWGSLSPTCASAGNLASFNLDVKNISAVPMTLTSASYFAFNDGVNTYCAYMNTASAGAVAAGAIKTLTFGSPSNAGAGGGVTVPAGFTQGSYLPMSNVTPCPAPALASGLYLYETVASFQRRNVTDFVSIAGRCGIDVIEWHEIK